MSKSKRKYNLNSQGAKNVHQNNFQNPPPPLGACPVTSYKGFFKTIKSNHKEIIKYNQKKIIRGVLLYTNEDTELNEYIKKHFQEFHKLSGKWCEIFILEKPSKEWMKDNISLMGQLKVINKIDKSEAYDIARELQIDLNQIPCLILFGESVNSQRLIIPIHQASAIYFRELFTKLEKIIYNVCNQTANLPNISPFDAISYHFDEIVNYLDSAADKVASQRVYSYQQQLIITQKLVIEDKSINISQSSKESNFNLQGAQFGGGLVNADTVNAHRIDGSINNNT